MLCSANTCSTRARIFDFALLARRIVSGIARPFGFLREIVGAYVERGVTVSMDGAANQLQTAIKTGFRISGIISPQP
jgi:hypothetical protein